MSKCLASRTAWRPHQQSHRHRAATSSQVTYSGADHQPGIAFSLLPLAGLSETGGLTQHWGRVQRISRCQTGLGRWWWKRGGGCPGSQQQPPRDQQGSGAQARSARRPWFGHHARPEDLPRYQRPGSPHILAKLQSGWWENDSLESSCDSGRLPKVAGLVNSPRAVAVHPSPPAPRLD